MASKKKVKVRKGNGVKCPVCFQVLANEITVQSHVRVSHLSYTKCLICNGGEFCDADTLLTHIKTMHPHILGMIPPPPERWGEPIQITRDYLHSRLRDWTIFDEKQIEVIENDLYFAGVCRRTKRTVFLFYVLNKSFLESPGGGKRHWSPGLKLTEDVRLTGVVVDLNLENTSGFSLTHGVPYDDMRISEKARDDTMLVPNGIAGRTKVNDGPLKTTEHQLHMTAKNLPEMGILCVFNYDDSSSMANVGGVPREIPSDIIKISFLGDELMQSFRIPNQDPDPDSHQNFLFFRKNSVEEALEGTPVVIRNPRPMTWDTTEIYICHKRGCGDTFETLRDRKIHLPYKHGNRKCPSCEEVQKETTELLFRQHVMTHQTTLFQTCEVEDCHKIFFNQKKLNKHMKNSHGEKTFICDICGKGWITEDKLKTHIAIHGEREPLKCDYCTKTFLHPEALNAHKRKAHATYCPDGMEASLFRRNKMKELPTTTYSPAKRMRTATRATPPDLATDDQNSMENESLHNENVYLWAEIERQREENESQREAIESQREEIESQREEIESQREEIERQREEIRCLTTKA